MKKVNRLVAILLAAILTTGSLQTYAFAGETAAPEKEEAIENVAAYEDAEPEAVSETAAGEDFEANAEETSAEEDSSMAEEDNENSTEESFNAGNDVTTSGATEIPAEDFSEEP